MKFQQKVPARSFIVGNTVDIEMKDCGTIALEPDEQVTFVTPKGAEYDLSRKDWGFYATPSLNGRLQNFELRTVLVKNRGTGRYFVLLVEQGHVAGFESYCTQENLAVIVWLDSTEALDSLTKKLGQ